MRKCLEHAATSEPWRIIGFYPSLFQYAGDRYRDFPAYHWRHRETNATVNTLYTHTPIQNCPSPECPWPHPAPGRESGWPLTAPRHAEESTAGLQYTTFRGSGPGSSPACMMSRSELQAPMAEAAEAHGASCIMLLIFGQPDRDTTVLSQEGLSMVNWHSYLLKFPPLGHRWPSRLQNWTPNNKFTTQDATFRWIRACKTIQDLQVAHIS